MHTDMLTTDNPIRNRTEPIENQIKIEIDTSSHQCKAPIGTGEDVNVKMGYNSRYKNRGMNKFKRDYTVI